MWESHRLSKKGNGSRESQNRKISPQVAVLGIYEKTYVEPVVMVAVAGVLSNRK